MSPVLEPPTTYLWGMMLDEYRNERTDLQSLLDGDEGWTLQIVKKLELKHLTSLGVETKKKWQSLLKKQQISNLVVKCEVGITYVVQQDTQLLLWLNIYSQYIWQLDMIRTYRSILRSIYKLCVAGLVYEDCVHTLGGCSTAT